MKKKDKDQKLLENYEEYKQFDYFNSFTTEVDN